MQPRPSQRPTVAVARFCLSCAGTLACWCVWLVLGAALGFQFYILIAREMPVPDFVLRRLDQRLAEAGLVVSSGRAEFDPTGKLLLQQVKLGTRRFSDPLLVAETVYLRKSVWSALIGEFTPEEVRLDHGTLQLPAPLSPTGLAEPLVRDLSATLRFEKELIHVDQLSFRMANLAVSVSGEYQPTVAAGPRLSPVMLIEQMLQHARRAARNLPELEAVSRPRLEVQLAVRPGIGNVAEFALHADGLERPRGLPLATGPLRARTTLRLDGPARRPARLNFETPWLIWAGRAQTGQIEGVATLEVAPGAEFAPETVSLQLMTRQVDALGETAQTPSLDLVWRPGAPLEFSVAAHFHDEPLLVRGTADLTDRRADVQFDGRVAPALVDSVLPVRAPLFAPYFRFGDPVTVHGSVELAEGWRFDGLHSRVRGGRLDSNGVQVTSLRGRIDIDAAGNFLAHEAVVHAGENHARGSYGMNFRSLDFRMLLTGALRPPHIAGWFRSGWWLGFWENFDFDAPPAADVDVRGGWSTPERTTYFGSTDTAGVRVRGADFERAHARVFVRSHFAHAAALQVERAGGTEHAQGWFKRRADPVTQELGSLEYDLSGRLSPATLRTLGGPAAEAALAPWSFTETPALSFRGRTDYTGEIARTDLRFSAEAADPLRFEGFPLEKLAVEGGISGDQVRLDRVETKVAGGRGHGKGSLSGEGEARRLGFDFYLEDADLVRTIRTLAEFDHARRGGTGTPGETNRDLLKRASGGRLNFALSARGQPGDLASFDGSGNLQVTGAELGEIHLFGLLSQVLSGLSLNFTSLKLDTMRGTFRVAQARATFPDLRITGPNSVIEARGDYRLAEQTLDFSARFRPYEERRNIITAALGIVVNPLTSIIELRLTGPIQKPSWSFSLGPGAPREPANSPPET